MVATTLKSIGLSVLLALAGLVALGTPAAAQNIGMVCTPGPTFTLQATSGYIITPDGNSVFMWGYTATNAFQMPGPVLCVNQGATVTVTLNNNLPEPVSIVFPGQQNVQASGGQLGALTREALPGGTVTYTFTATEPGTYLYESGTQPHKQVHMGLYGVLVVRPPDPTLAYNDPSTRFSGEFLLVLHEIDPDLHRAVELGSRLIRPSGMTATGRLTGARCRTSSRTTFLVSFPASPMAPWCGWWRGIPTATPTPSPSWCAMPTLAP